VEEAEESSDLPAFLLLTIFGSLLLYS